MEKMNAYILVAFHVILSLMALMLGYLGLLIWPTLSGSGAFPMMVLLIIGAISTHFFSFKASRDIMNALRGNADFPSLNLMPFLCGGFTIIVAAFMMKSGGA